MTQVTTYGLYQDSIEKKSTQLSMDFIVPLELMSRWERCSLISDFMAQYNPLDQDILPKSTNLLSTILNELLENAIKFSTDKLVNVSIKHFGDEIEIEAINITNTENVGKLMILINSLNQTDSEVLLLQSFEKTIESPQHDYSGLGLLSLIQDYNSHLGIKIVPKSENLDHFEVYIKIQIPLKELS